MLHNNTIEQTIAILNVYLFNLPLNNVRSCNKNILLRKCCKTNTLNVYFGTWNSVICNIKLQLVGMVLYQSRSIELQLNRSMTPW